MLVLWMLLIQSVEWQPDAHATFRGSFNTTESEFTRSRLQILSGVDASFDDHWQGRIAGRAFYDPLLRHQSSRPETVKSDEGYDLELRTAFVEYSNLPFKTRLGLQEVVWGEALHYFSADILHPKDYRDGFLNSLAWARRPQFGLWSSYRADLWSIEFVYFPVSRLHRYPRHQAEFAIDRFLPESLGLPTAATETLFKFDQPTLGVNLGVQRASLELHLMGAWMRDLQPHLVFEGGATSFRSQPLGVVAATASYAVSNFLVRVESQGFFHRRLNRLNGMTLESKAVTEINNLLSLEYSRFENILITVHGFWLQRLGCQSDQILNCRILQEGLQLLWMNLPYDFELETSLWLEAADPAAWWSLRLRRPLSRHLKAELALEEFYGSATGSSLFAEWRNQDQIILQLDYLF